MSALTCDTAARNGGTNRNNVAQCWQNLTSLTSLAKPAAAVNQQQRTTITHSPPTPSARRHHSAAPRGPRLPQQRAGRATYQQKYKLCWKRPETARGSASRPETRLDGARRQHTRQNPKRVQDNQKDRKPRATTKWSSRGPRRLSEARHRCRRACALGDRRRSLYVLLHSKSAPPTSRARLSRTPRAAPSPG